MANFIFSEETDDDLLADLGNLDSSLSDNDLEAGGSIRDKAKPSKPFRKPKKTSKVNTLRKTKDS